MREYLSSPSIRGTGLSVLIGSSLYRAFQRTDGSKISFFRRLVEKVNIYLAAGKNAIAKRLLRC
jgi:hypothetical protein